jgi:hypothetical protein
MTRGKCDLVAYSVRSYKFFESLRQSCSDAGWNLARPAERLVAFYNQRGAVE